MADIRFDASRTAVLLVDPYNDFLSEGGKSWPRAKAIAEDVHLLDHMRTVVAAARQRGIKIAFVPHHRWEPGTYEDWRHATPYQLAGAKKQVFAKGTWGGTFHDDFQAQQGDIVAHEHWGSSGFANTDLDQQLRQHDIENVILIGMLASTCIEATGRFAMELGYHVTLVSDATADFSVDAMRAFAENAPKYSHHIATTAALLTALG